METTVDRDLPVEEHPYYKDYLSKFNHDREWELIYPKGWEKCFFDWNLLTLLIFGSFLKNVSYKLELDRAWTLNPQGKPRVHLIFQIRDDEAPNIKPLDEYRFTQAVQQIRIFTEEQIGNYELAAEDDDCSEYEEEKAKRLRIFELEVKRVMAYAKVCMSI